MPTYSIEVFCGQGRRGPKINLICDTDDEAIHKARRVAQNGYAICLYQGLRPVTAFKASVPAEPRTWPAAQWVGASP